MRIFICLLLLISILPRRSSLKIIDDSDEEDDESTSVGSRADDVIVEVSQGKLAGFKIDLVEPPYGDAKADEDLMGGGKLFKKADIFLAIPFAKAPEEDLRFEVKN